MHKDQSLKIRVYKQARKEREKERERGREGGRERGFGECPVEKINDQEGN